MADCPTCSATYPDDVRVCASDGTLLDPVREPAREPDLPAGTKVGDYSIVARLGRGGFGTVYEVVHDLIGKRAALKVLHGEYAARPDVVERFVAEARAVNHIGHRGIVDVFAFGTLPDGRSYSVMELLRGETLKRCLAARGRLAPEVALRILHEVSRALDAAHAAGIVHRDLKPENVLLADDGEGGVVPKLLDFGIAKLMGGRTPSVTQSGAPLGTPAYMSPEQCRGKPVDRRTDVYALGVLAHEMLTGRAPFTGDDVLDLMMQQTSAPPPPASTICTELPPLLDPPILAMLEKDPARRPASAGAAVDALREAAIGAGLLVGAPGSSHIRLPARPVSLGPGSGSTAVARSDVGGSLLGSAHEIRPTAGRKRLVAAFGIAVAVLAVGVVIATQRGAGPSSATPGLRAATDAAGTAIASNAGREVEIRFVTTPEAVDVRIDGRRVGRSSTSLRVLRSTQPLTFELAADGYMARAVTIVPSSDLAMPIVLDRLAPDASAKPSASAPPPQRGQRPAGTQTEIENPFR